VAIIINPQPDLNSRVFFKESIDSLDVDLDVNLIRKIGDHLYETNGSVASLQGSAAGELGDELIRSSKVAFFDPKEYLGDLFHKISNSISLFNAKYWNFDLTSFVENWQYTIYESSENGHYDWHVDNIDSHNSSPRKLSVVIQLSDPDEYEGGELMFNFGSLEGDKIAVKKKGTIIMFPSYVLHKVAPVTAGVRRSLVFWVSGPGFR